MTADVVNLRRARKAKARSDAADTASANRAKFGRSATKRAVQEMTADIATRRLDGHKLATAPATREGDGR